MLAFPLAFQACVVSFYSQSRFFFLQIHIQRSSFQGDWYLNMQTNPSASIL